jgi:hypothetical protein
VSTTTHELKSTMDEFMGGSDGRYRHWANRRLIYTEGIKAMADKAGAHWLLDIVATEVAPIGLKRWEAFHDPSSYLEVKVVDSKATLRLVRDDELPSLWERKIEFTDFPEGEWVFELSMDGLVDPKREVLVMLLLQEH